MFWFNKIGMQNNTHSSPQSFDTLFNELLSQEVSDEIFQAHGPARRRPAILSARDLVKAMVFQNLQASGTLAQAVELGVGLDISDAALSQRRTCMEFEPFYWILESALKPVADPQEHPEAFYKGWRLLGIDGTQSSVTNTPQIASLMSKARTRRFKAAFAKVRLCVVVELGLRNPISAAIGIQGESENELAKELLKKLPEDGLIIGDRLFGVRPILALLKKWVRQFLVRVKSNMKCRVIEILGDGSALVEVETENGKMILREINGRVKRPDGAWVSVRLWTSLLDWRENGALELLALYSRRWEQEVFYRELKVEMRTSPVMRSHTPETAAQEMAAWVMAHAVLVRARMAAARVGKVEVLQISFGKTLALMQPLWQVVKCCRGILTDKQIGEMTERVLEILAGWVVPERRKRTCPRAVRQPVSSWPRLVHNSYQTGPTEFEILPAAI